MAKTRFEVLDGWRGFAALFVATTHAPILSHVLFTAFNQNAWLWVDFFFVLSGFIISTAYAGKLNTAEDVGDYAIRRFGRLWPLHAATLAVLVGAELLKIAARLVTHRPADMIPLYHAPETGVLSIVANLLLVQSLGLQNFFTAFGGWNFPSWSISVEFYANIVFALFFLTARRWREMLIVAACVMSGVVYFFLVRQGLDNPFLPFFRGLFGFLSGHIVNLIYRRGIRLPYATVTELLATAAMFGFVMAMTLTSNLRFFSPLVFGAAILVFAAQRGMVSNIFRLRFIQCLGLWSYSIYLVHALVLQPIEIVARHAGALRFIKLPDFVQPMPIVTFGATWMGDAALCVYLLSVVGVAAFTYRYLEVPARRFFYRLATRFSQPQAAPIPAGG